VTRSPRAGWVLVELVDGVWRRIETGDRDAMRAAYLRRSLELRHEHGIQPVGHAVAAYDAKGQKREYCPNFPRTADGTRVRWPSTTPVDGATPEARVARAATLGGA
jgi:hypothetical protein